MFAHTRLSWLILVLAAESQFASANDADVSDGGSPKLLNGRSTVQMRRERIAMTVGSRITTVDCDFWFRNDGPACTVRMGFPDEGNANEDGQAGDKPASNFLTFKSWVDGKSVGTRLIQGDDGIGWHVKTVRLGARASVHVRDRYASTNGSGIASAGQQQCGCLWDSYIVHTGSSWKGAIGKTEISVTFDRSFARHGLKAVPAKKLSKGADGRALAKAPFPAPGTIVFRGVSTPKVHGRTLRFSRTNWRPTSSDDLELWFGYGPFGR